MVMYDASVRLFEQPPAALPRPEVLGRVSRPPLAVDMGRPDLSLMAHKAREVFDARVAQAERVADMQAALAEEVVRLRMLDGELRKLEDGMRALVIKDVIHRSVEEGSGF